MSDKTFFQVLGAGFISFIVAMAIISLKIEKKSTSEYLSNPSEKTMYELKLENMKLDNEKKRLEIELLKK